MPLVTADATKIYATCLCRCHLDIPLVSADATYICQLSLQMPLRYATCLCRCHLDMPLVTADATKIYATCLCRCHLDIPLVSADSTYMCHLSLQMPLRQRYTLCCNSVD